MTLPEVMVSNRQPRELVEECWQVLLASPIGGRIFRFGSALVRVPDRGEGLDTLDPVKLTGLLHRIADWMREDEGGVRPGRVPPDVARDMVALPDAAVPRLTGLTSLPVLRRDGDCARRRGPRARQRPVLPPRSELDRHRARTHGQRPHRGAGPAP